MISNLYGDYYRFRKDWKRIRITGWIRVILSGLLGGIGIGLILAPVLMLLLHSWTVEFALSVATMNVLVGLILAGTGKWIFDSTKDHQIVSFVYYAGTLISLVLFLIVTAVFYPRFTYIIATG